MALALGEGGGRTTPVPEEWLASVLAFRGVGPVTIQIVGRMAFLCRYSNFRNTERRTASQNLALSACSRMSEKYFSGLQKSAFVQVHCVDYPPFPFAFGEPPDAVIGRQTLLRAAF